ncbi:hypothetical protein BDY17DRAFT_17064 [Neohortaea acidophila]|uniref:Extracellular membrane protein CFEM domain-containing protein n=1 Tax=Neohortaea acidophila TaxID=245834 RepID=A0A6A6Q5Y1_9PEZI|nr:uncharacterized protein BDY17DRAFT_17064 [Neohortaea acidophila]KAF2487725.1 hypothetical protein BDY17DRAFT_17064 [Neohortaea acidophila]
MKVPTLLLVALIPVVLAGGVIDKREPKSKKSTSTTSTSIKHTSTSTKHTSTSTKHTSTSTSTKSTSTKQTSTPTKSKKNTTLQTTTSAPTTTAPPFCPNSRTIQCASEYLSCPCVAQTVAPGQLQVEICQNIQGYYVCDGPPSIYYFSPSSMPAAKATPAV